MNRKAQLAIAEVDNPNYSRDHPENLGNPRTIMVSINRRADAASAIRSLTMPQKRAASEFVDLWRTHNGMHGRSIGEHVDHHHAPSISDAVIDAGYELQQCRNLIGTHNYRLLEEVFPKGRPLTDLFPVKRDSNVPAVRLQRRIASHTIKTALDYLARRWSYM